MKWIKYRLLVGKTDNGAELFQDMGLEYNVENETYIKGIAHNGEYTIEDDGQPEPKTEVSTDDVLNALLGVTV